MLLLWWALHLGPQLTLTDENLYELAKKIAKIIKDNIKKGSRGDFNPPPRKSSSSLSLCVYVYVFVCICMCVCVCVCMCVHRKKKVRYFFASIPTLAQGNTTCICVIVGQGAIFVFYEYFFVHVCVF